jgi:uncharacterized protein with FMN-binding domain
MNRARRGAALFAAIMAGVSATVGARLLLGDDGGDGTGTEQGAQAADSPGSASAPQPSSTSGSGTGSGSGSGSGTSTVQGAAEETRFGTVQVAVTFTGSKITSVQTLQAPSGRGRDQMLTQYATPLLAKEVIASQSARVDTISGATYTSEGYLASVQSAIDAHK